MKDPEDSDRPQTKEFAEQWNVRGVVSGKGTTWEGQPNRGWYVC